MVNEYFQSERLLYRPFQMDDLQILHRLFNEKSRRRWFYFQEPDCLTLEYALKEIQKNMTIWSRKVNLLQDACDLAIVLKETGEMIGNIGISKFHGPDEELDDIEIGYCIAEAHQGMGHCTEAAKAAVQWGFERLKELGAELKIVGKAEHENWPSRKVLEHAGFSFVCAERYLSVYEIRG